MAAQKRSEIATECPSPTQILIREQGRRQEGRGLRGLTRTPTVQ